MTLHVDSLRALIGGLGDETRDKRAGVYYGPSVVTDLELFSAYRSSWLARKICNIPAQDSVREWRDWKAEKEQIEAIEAEEKRLMLRQKVFEARVKARLWGGAAIYLSDGSANIAAPFEPERMKQGGIRYLTVLSKYDLQAGEIDYNPESETFNEPKFYSINGRDIHPSRLVRFKGAALPDERFMFGLNHGWGDSVLQAVFDSIKDCDSAVRNVASMIFEATVDVFGVPDLLDQLNSPDYVSRLQTRMALAAANKGINRSLLKDSLETYERKQIAFGSIPELLDKFMQFVSGGADIPATRLFGMSPAGMSSTGESDLRNYYDGINSEQELFIEPALRRFDEALIRSATGQRDASIWYEWAPLWQMSDKERAEYADKMASVAERLNRTGLVSSPALSNAVINQMTEDGVYPGLEQNAEDDPIDWEVELEKEEQDRQAGLAATLAKVAPQPVADAAPRSLYVQRKVKNAAAIIAWAKAQGIPVDPLQAINLHVTVVYSKAAVDWFKVGEPWASELKIAEGGPRLVEQFDGGATVLLFACREITYRHQQVMELGGSHGFEEYQPHITISYRADRVDLSQVEPYQGEIILGPELFAELR